MSKFLKIVLLCGCVLSASYSFAQKDDFLSMKDGKMILKINTNITQSTLDSIMKKINMMSLSLDSLIQKNLSKQYVLDGWVIDKIGKDAVELSKNLSQMENHFDLNNPFIISSQAISEENNFTYFPQAPFGYNSFKKRMSVKPLPNSDKTRFVLYGKLKANSVYLSGDFNAWATEDNRMIKTDTAWYCDIKLTPGKHIYKFIVDGEWISDPENKQREDDTYGAYNSVYFVCNHIFQLENYESAKKVILSGSFNDWNERDLVMLKSQNSWILPVYLQDGTYQYKFIVDKNWITDPKCKTNIDDGFGNINSVQSIGEPTVFTLDAFAYANEVYLAGDFNNWRRNEIKLTRENKVWKCQYVLAPGNYLYKYVVDGNWIEDANSTLKVVQPNYTFTLRGYPNAKDVRISGSFINWINPGISMIKKDSIWVCSFHLNPGKHNYKFIVDGNWIIDPDNPLYENNEYDTGNSFIWFDDKNNK